MASKPTIKVPPLMYAVRGTTGAEAEMLPHIGVPPKKVDDGIQLLEPGL
jgi:hypothetical protein